MPLNQALLKGMTLQKESENIQLIEYLPAIFNLSHLLDTKKLASGRFALAIREVGQVGRV